jgi:two-component system, chemotaxis family, chemotaxis protein CheY
MSRRLLIVEDDAEIRASIAELFEAEGYEISMAEDGREALELLRRESEPPGLILLDLMMPTMDGFEFRAEQQKDARLAAIPVLLMSAGGDLGAKAAALGTKGYLKKPFGDLDAILDAVARAF